MKPYAQNRMRKLIELLRTKVPRKNFDMGHWYNKSPCGTVCCIGGWACAIPSFKKAGLKLEFEHGDPNDKYGADYKIIFNGKFFDNALADFFDLSYEEANELFFNWPQENPQLVRTPKQAAKRLERFLQNKIKMEKS